MRVAHTYTITVDVLYDLPQSCSHTVGKGHDLFPTRLDTFSIGAAAAVYAGQELEERKKETKVGKQFLMKRYELSHDALLNEMRAYRVHHFFYYCTFSILFTILPIIDIKTHTYNYVLI